MTKRIFRSIFLVASAVLIAALAVIMGILYEHFTLVQKNSLAEKAVLAAQGVEKAGIDYLEAVVPKGCRLTWVDDRGTVLFDSEADAATMENHADREEIQQALSTGTGESERDSATLSKKTFYYALRLGDGTVLRVAEGQYTVVSLLLGMAQPFVLLLGAAVALSAVLASRVSRRIVEPLNKLDLEHPLENEAYEELSPLLTRIERQHRQIRQQMEALSRKKEEFDAVTDSMSEGLILLNAQGVILSINPAAMSLFRTSRDCIGQDILTVERSLPLQELIRDAAGGKHAETVLTVSGREYQLEASPVQGEPAGGVCILAFEATDKLLAERMRREFSANVSHELKTPLQSIIGAAELLENGMVKQEDIPHFVTRIRTEAARLVALIEDIIRLSELDEGGSMPLESVPLLALAQETASALAPAAEAAGVQISVGGEAAAVTGVRRLLHEIVYNLCDNAIKYNTPGGSVSLTVLPQEDGALLTVADTGIGVPQEHQGRIFERFYRVDKSHSKATGGTGLGLSIVKHAVQYHGGSIRLESEPGRGTRISVFLPAKPPSDV